MIPVETVIRKLIVDYEFVILPGFGALISRQIPVNYDKESGSFSPPAKRLAFNESLKLDDGLIANYISRHENIAHSEAVVYIRRYTDRLWAVLESRGEAKIAGIGNFKANSEGRLVFDPTTERHFKDEWYGFHNINVKLVTPNSSLSTTSQKMIVEEGIEYVEEEQELLAHKVQWWRWASAALIIGLLGYFSIDFVSDQSGNTSNLNPLRMLFPTENIRIEESNAVEDVIPVKQVFTGKESPEPVDSSETVSTVTEPAADTATEIAPPARPEVAIKSGGFFVIAGAFKGSKQATILLEQLRKKGFEHALLIPADKRSSKVKVAVDRFELETDAYKASKKLKEVTGEIGWVYKVK